MERVYEAGAVAAAPAAPAEPSSGFPTAGNPGLGIDATKPGPYWFHMITEEMRAVITAAGLVPDHTNLGQLLAALQGGFGLAKSLDTTGYATLPGGLILQWGRGNMITGTTVTVTFPIAFPNAAWTVLATEMDATATAFLVALAPTTTQVQVAANVTAGVFHWMAIGR